MQAICYIARYYQDFGKKKKKRKEENNFSKLPKHNLAKAKVILQQSEITDMKA